MADQEALGAARSDYPAFIDPPRGNFTKGDPKTSSDFVKGTIKFGKKTGDGFAFPFLGLRFAANGLVNQALMESMIAAQKAIFDICRGQLKQQGITDPTEEQYAVWCWTGVLPLGDPTNLPPDKQKVRLKQIDFSTNRSGGYHTSGSAIDINVSPCPYIATRTGGTYGGENDVGLQDDLLQEVAELDAAGMEQRRIALERKRNGKELTDDQQKFLKRVDAAVDKFKKDSKFLELLATTVWRPAVIGYDDACSLFQGKIADVAGLRPTESAKECHERFFEVSECLRRYFALAFSGKDKAKSLGAFQTALLEQFKAGGIHPDATLRTGSEPDSQREKLYVAFGSKARAEELVAADKRLAAAETAVKQAETDAKARKEAVDKTRKTAKDKRIHDEQVAEAKHKKAAAGAAAEAKAAQTALDAAAKIADPTRREAALDKAQKQANAAQTHAETAESNLENEMKAAAHDEEDSLRKADDTQKENEGKDRQQSGAAKDQLKSAQEQKADAVAHADERAQKDVNVKKDLLDAAKASSVQTASVLAAAEADEKAKRDSGASAADIAAAEEQTRQAKVADAKAQDDVTAKEEALKQAQERSRPDQPKQDAAIARLFSQILEDYERIKLVFVNGQLKLSKDRKTFVAGNTRDPRDGFLHIRREVAVALMDTGSNLAWGACTGFGAGAFGDIMHFDLRRDGL
jgi:chorismate mutase